MAIYQGKISSDDRGSVTFINDFDFKDVKRFYIVENKRNPAVRAWHGHKKEAKYVFVVSGSAKIGVVNMDTEVMTIYHLSAKNPQIICIPPGNYNGARTLEKGTRIMYYSTSTLEESQADDFRQPQEKWEL